MKIKRGDIFLIHFPYVDRSTSKLRPCVIVQNNASSQKLQHGLFALITSRTDRVAREETQVLVDITTTEGKQTGLLQTSTIDCVNINTLSYSFIHKKIGSLPPVLLQELDEALKAALGIQ